ncbi:MAG: thiol:disulfide interchange protein DsbA/DsbL [Succinivibrio sp.]
MANLVRLVAAVFFSFVFTHSAQAKNYELGKDYEIRAENITATPEIREFFSFYCSHCYANRGTFDKIAEHFKGQAKFVYNPVSLIGGELGFESQQAYAVALNMGLEKDIMNTLFDKVHKLNQIPEDHEYFVDLFESIGIEKDRYEQEAKSFVTIAKCAEWDRKAQEFKIDAVPEILVNGKYLVLSDNVESADDYISLIKYLLTLK